MAAPTASTASSQRGWLETARSEAHSASPEGRSRHRPDTMCRQLRQGHRAGQGLRVDMGGNFPPTVFTTLFAQNTAVHGQ